MVKLVCFLVVVFMAAMAGANRELKVGYYEKTCKDVEKIVNSIVVNSIKDNRGKGAGLVRLLFHDCFVRVRIDRTSHLTERHACMQCNARRARSLAR